MTKRDYGLPGIKGIRSMDTVKKAVIRTAGDLWKGLHEGLIPTSESDDVCKAINDVLHKLSEMELEPSDVLHEAMRRLIAKVAITMNVDQTHVINMEFAEFAKETEKPLFPDVGWDAHE